MHWQALQDHHAIYRLSIIIICSSSSLFHSICLSISPCISIVHYYLSLQLQHSIYSSSLFHEIICPVIVNDVAQNLQISPPEMSTRIFSPAIIREHLRNIPFFIVTVYDMALCS